MTRWIPTIAALALLSAAIPTAPANAAAGVSPARAFVPRQVVLKLRGAPHERIVRLPAGVSVHRAIEALRNRSRVEYAAPNYIATASGTTRLSAIANDPGLLSYPTAGPPGGWVSLQWNFLPWKGTPTAAVPISPGGADVIGAWRHLIDAGRPGAQGIIVAVLDTGVAYRGQGANFLPSPDFTPGQFVPGYDFIGHDRLPLDTNGHGTHVAGTIAEKTDNGIGLTGIAYGAKLMPVRVLNRRGVGPAGAIAKGIRFAVAHGADVINMSFNFPCGTNLPGVDRELLRAYYKGVVTVASIGNRHSEECISPPARGPRTIGVGGTTEGGCLGRYSALPGRGVDLLAPGGGISTKGCRSVFRRSIYQVTLRMGNPTLFGEPSLYVGTSMAAAHVSGVAALVLASDALDPRASPTQRVAEVAARLRETARNLDLPPQRQGAGLIDAAAATRPAT